MGKGTTCPPSLLPEDSAFSARKPLSPHLVFSRTLFSPPTNFRSPSSPPSVFHLLSPSLTPISRSLLVSSYRKYPSGKDTSASLSSRFPFFDLSSSHPFSDRLPPHIQSPPSHNFISNLLLPTTSFFDLRHLLLLFSLLCFPQSSSDISPNSRSPPTPPPLLSPSISTIFVTTLTGVQPIGLEKRRLTELTFQLRVKLIWRFLKRRCHRGRKRMKLLNDNAEVGHHGPDPQMSPLGPDPQKRSSKGKELSFTANRDKSDTWQAVIRGTKQGTIDNNLQHSG